MCIRDSSDYRRSGLKYAYVIPTYILFLKSNQVQESSFFITQNKQVTMYCSKRQFAFDVRNVRILKYGHIRAHIFGAYSRSNARYRERCMQLFSSLNFMLHQLSSSSSNVTTVTVCLLTYAHILLHDSSPPRAITSVRVYVRNGIGLSFILTNTPRPTV